MQQDSKTAIDKQETTQQYTIDPFSMYSEYTFGQALDRLLNAGVGTLGIYSATWNNKEIYVTTIDISNSLNNELKDYANLGFAINYPNGLQMMWHPSPTDLFSKHWKIKTIL